MTSPPKMNVPAGFKILEVPARIRAMIPDKYGAEYFLPTPDYGEGQLLCITYGKNLGDFVHVDGMLAVKVLIASDNDIKRSIIRPMLESMKRHIEHRDRFRKPPRLQSGDQPSGEEPAIHQGDSR
jgi:hypothetical protein